MSNIPCIADCYNNLVLCCMIVKMSLVSRPRPFGGTEMCCPIRRETGKCWKTIVNVMEIPENIEKLVKNVFVNTYTLSCHVKVLKISDVDLTCLL